MITKEDGTTLVNIFHSHYNTPPHWCHVLLEPLRADCMDLESSQGRGPRTFTQLSISIFLILSNSCSNVGASSAGFILFSSFSPSASVFSVFFSEKYIAVVYSAAVHMILQLVAPGMELQRKKMNFFSVVVVIRLLPSQ